MKKTLCLLLAALLLVGLTACGTPTEESAETTLPAPTTAALTTEEPTTVPVTTEAVATTVPETTEAAPPTAETAAPTEPPASSTTKPTTAPTQPPATQPVTDPPTEAPTEPPTQAPTEPTPDYCAIAHNYIGSPVSALYAAIGRPNSANYAPSCGGDYEDGILEYSGFTVYTARYADGTETVVDVWP